MVDCPRHVHLLAEFWAAQTSTAPRELQLCVDLDMSFRPLGSLLHLGVHRSPCRSMADVVSVWRAARAHRGIVAVTGVMGYEAQVSGLPDLDPAAPFLRRHVLFPLLKRLSLPGVFRFRAAAVAGLKAMAKEAGVPFSDGELLVNGAGTGSADASAADPSITEITVGSGLLHSHTFDKFRACTSKPALVFGLPVTRRSDPGVVCCQGGGFIASGATSATAQPAVHLPKGLAPFPEEGWGEVQTPLHGPDADGLQLGDPVFCRPSKAGEPAERFCEYHLLKDGAMFGRTQTYRGLGKAFH